MSGLQRALLGTGAVLLVAVGSVASPASAAGPTVVTGKITQVTSSTLKVKTSTGVVTGKLSTIAVITKSARASLSSVVKGAFASVSLASNGKTVTRISVGTRGGVRRTRPSTGTRTFRGPRTGAFASGRFHGGTVVSITKSQISLKAFTGKTQTYSLSKTVAVTKSERGTRADLHVGETVRIIPMGTGATTFSLTIVSG